MSDNDYARRQAEKDREYAGCYDTPEALKWLDSLPPEERHRLEADGLLKPMMDRSGSTMRDEDAAEMPVASCPGGVGTSSDSFEAILADYPQIQDAIEERARQIAGGVEGTEMLRKLSLMFIDEQRRGLNADCLAFISGIAVRMGESGTSLAQKHGITRQAFHKRCGDLRKELGLPPTRAQKSDQSKHSYRLANRRWSKK